MKRTITLFVGLFALLFTFQLHAQENLEGIINSPGSLAGTVQVGPPAADFGGNLAPGEEVTGDLAVVFAQNSMGNDTIAQQGCDSLLNGMEIMGNIALIRRGNCFFSDKVHYAEQQGAIAAIICNSNPGEAPITMGAGGDFAGTATIPSAMFSYEVCDQILQEIDAGGTVNVTLRVPTFYNQFFTYSYHTPLTHTVANEDIQINLVNASGAVANDVEVSVDITDPDGEVTTFTEVIETFDILADSTISFDDYTPEKLGEYSVRFYNTLNTDEITDNFVMTEDIFAPDRGTPTGSAGPSDEQFGDVNGGYNNYYGTLQITGDADNTIATHCVFGIENAAEILTGDPQYDAINVVLYDTDADEDGELDWSGAATQSFDDLTPVALGIHVLTGNEDPAELISVPLTDFLGQPYQLKPNHYYTVSIQYNGDADAAPSPPDFLSTGDVPYFAYTTVLYLDNTLYNGGWSGETVICRLIIDETTSAEDVSFLAEGSATIAPNPASDYVTLDLDLVDAADVHIDIMGYDGRILESRDLGQVQNGTFEFDVTEYPAGMYFMSVKSSVGYQSIAFTVAH
jgi:hypothetical protein